LKSKKLRHTVNLVLDFVDSITEGVYSSVDNLYCHEYRDMTSKQEVCPKFLPTIVCSTPNYWRKGIQVSQLSDYEEELMNANENVKWLSDRIPYKRNPKTDPESWAPNKKNPFDSNHLPRVYVSLGTAANNNPPIWEGILNALNEKGFPTKAACGGSESLFKILQE